MLLTYERIHPDMEIEELDFECADRDEALDFIEYEVSESNSPFVNQEGWSLHNFVLHNDDGTEEDLSSYADRFVKDWSDESQW